MEHGHLRTEGTPLSVEQQIAALLPRVLDQINSSLGDRIDQQLHVALQNFVAMAWKAATVEQERLEPVLLRTEQMEAGLGKLAREIEQHGAFYLEQHQRHYQVLLAQVRQVVSEMSTEMCQQVQTAASIASTQVKKETTAAVTAMRKESEETQRQLLKAQTTVASLQGTVERVSRSLSWRLALAIGLGMSVLVILVGAMVVFRAPDLMLTDTMKADLRKGAEFTAAYGEATPDEQAQIYRLLGWAR